MFFTCWFILQCSADVLANFYDAMVVPRNFGDGGKSAQMKNVLLLLLLIALLYGCAGSPARISLDSPDALKKRTIQELCAAYGKIKSEKLLYEIKSRRAGFSDTAPPFFSDRELRAITSRVVYVGMREIALVCSLGWPTGYDGSGINRSSHGPDQWVYRSCSGCKATYVYVRGGKVIAWQN